MTIFGPKCQLKYQIYFVKNVYTGMNRIRVVKKKKLENIFPTILDKIKNCLPSEESIKSKNKKSVKPVENNKNRIETYIL